jgi:hypothetical protein
MSSTSEQEGVTMSRPTPPNDTNKNQDQPPVKTSNNTPGLTFDWRDWLPYFEYQDIPEAQKRELIETLWQIIVAFVDLGFDLNPHQQAEQKSCGQNLDLKMLLEAAVLKSAAVQEANDRKPKQKEPTP